MKLGAWMGLGLVVLAGCSGEPQIDDGVETSSGFYADSAPPTKDQSGELAELGPVEDVAFRPVTHDLELLRGPALADAAGDPATATTGFVSAHPALFSGAVARVDQVQSGEEGTRVFASQMAGDRRVLEGALVFDFDADGKLTQVAGGTRTVPQLPTAQIDGTGAEDLARRALQAELPGTVPLVTAMAEPVVYEGRGAFLVMLEANPASGPVRRALVIDDQTGEPLEETELLQSLTGHGLGALGDSRSFEITDLGSRYGLVDGTRGQGIFTYVANGAELPGDLVTSTSTTRWDATGEARGAAVDAHANAELVFDYYRDVHGRAGIDGRSAPLVSTVHYGQGFNNAFWDGTQMVYGDGDGQTFAPLAAGLDVVAHELTHGVSQFSCSLGYKGQAGALNEAISDAFASFVQRRSGDPALAWIIGATVYTPGQSGDALRDLSDPQRLGQPDHMSLFVDAPKDAKHDNGNVHLNSTIPGHAFFLMSEGGTNRTSGRSAPGIGADKAEKVLYDALTHGLTASADFPQCARATIASAQKLYGTHAADGVRLAWEAVGVLVPEDGGQPTQDAGSGDAEPNNSRRKASPLALGTAVTGEVGDAKDVDYFRFELDSARDVTLTLAGLTTDLDLRVYDARGRIVARSEQPGRHDEVVRAHAKRGGYYAKVFAPKGTAVSHAGYRLELQ